MKRSIYLILFLFLLFPINVFAIVNPTDEFYINDYAGILTKETEEYILNKSVALNRVDGTQIVVVTVKNLDGMSLEEYANKLFRKFGIGDSKKDNGLLLLLALEERQFRVEVGDGLGGILPDGKTGRFQDEYIIPYLKENKWNEGIKNGYDAFYSEIVIQNNLNVDYNKPVQVGGSTYPNFIYYIIIFIGMICGFCNSVQKGKDKTIFTIGYLIFWGIAFVAILINAIDLILAIFMNLCFFIAASFGGSPSIRVGGGHRGGSGGGFSGGGFSGGGGFSSGGGSSRGF